MKFLIEGQLVTAQPIAQFRQAHQLPDTFGIAQFASVLPYNPIWSNATILTNAGERAKQTVPHHIKIDQLPFQVDNLVSIFRTQIVQHAVPFAIGVEEIEQVTEHLRDFLLRPAYKLIELEYSYRTAEDWHNRVLAEFDMEAIYDTTLQETSQLDYAGQPYETPNGEQWKIRPIHNIFGPAALEIETGPDTYLYTHDEMLALPAAPLIQSLSIDLGNKLAQNITNIRQ